MAFFAAINFASSQGVARVLLGTVLDYLTFAVIFAIIYMLFQLVTNGKGVGGIGNLFGDKDKGDDNTDSSNRRRRGDDGTSEGKGGKGEDNEDSKDENSIDFENLGQVKFLVRNLNGEPIENATVKVYPSKAKWFFKKWGKKGRYYTGLTNTEGTFPSTNVYLDVPSGTLKYEVLYTLPTTMLYRSGGRQYFHVKSDVEIKQDNPTIIPVTLEFYSEYAAGFEPHIEKVEQITGKDGKKYIRYQGIIKP